MLVNVGGFALAAGLYETLVELSPYRTYPLNRAEAAVAAIARGLGFNRKSPLLNRNMGLYQMHLGHYEVAAKHFRLSVPKSKDPRRARFFAVCSELTFVPRDHLRRGLRITWSRLSDEQRVKFMRQLRQLVADRDGIVSTVEKFTHSAFRTRKTRNTRTVAQANKLRRIAQKDRRAAETTDNAIRRLSKEERERLGRDFNES